MPYGLYIHIPYCRARCAYCDFYTQAVAGGVPDAYIAALLRDYALYAPKDGAGRPRFPTTVYLGGGTPGLLTPAQVARLLDAIAPAAGAEITLETNPGLGEGHFAGWRSAGVNRLSLGVQSACDASLRRLGRLHDATMAKKALEAAAKAGFAQISGDIMLALPGYTRQEFDDTLDLLAGRVGHISAYLLKLEPGTPLAQSPPSDLPDDDQVAEFYLYAVDRLGLAGYRQYEISNFSLPGNESQHNLLYWTGGEWLGLGPAAHSRLGKNRFSFPPYTPPFLKDGLAPQQEGEMAAEDALMLALRLNRGIDEASFEEQYGFRFTQTQRVLLHRFVVEGLARQTPVGYALTPRGMLVQNSILAALLS